MDQLRAAEVDRSKYFSSHQVNCRTEAFTESQALSLKSNFPEYRFAKADKDALLMKRALAGLADAYALSVGLSHAEMLTSLAPRIKSAWNI